MGNNTLDKIEDRDKGQAIQANQIKTAACGTLYPRNVSGVAADLASSIGSAIYRWSNFFCQKLFLKDSSASTLEIYEDGVDGIKIDVNSVNLINMDSYGNFNKTAATKVTNNADLSGNEMIHDDASVIVPSGDLLIQKTFTTDGGLVVLGATNDPDPSPFDDYNSCTSWITGVQFSGLYAGSPIYELPAGTYTANFKFRYTGNGTTYKRLVSIKQIRSYL